MTERQAIDGGGWFDLHRAERWDEGTRWNGNNMISLATGSQWNHQVLFRTAKGAWVLWGWSQWQGSGESWERITEEAAVQWLIANDHDVPEGLDAGGLEV